MEEANLVGANLQNANLRKAILRSTDFTGADLSYASGGGPSRHKGYSDPKHNGNNVITFNDPSTFDQGIKEKSRMGIPERFYANCIDDGWIARNFIPWYKANSMPSSVKDRFTNKWEPVFFFAKSGRYYFNLDEVREKTVTESKPPKRKHSDVEHAQGKLFDDTPEKDDSSQEDRKYAKNVNPHGNAHSIAKSHSGIYDMDTGELLNHPLGRNPGDFLSDIEYAEDDIPENYNDKWKDGKRPDQATFENGKWRKHYDDNGNCLGCGKHWTKHTVSNRAKGSMHEASKRTEDIVWCNPKGRNPGDVFFINPKPFLEAHFATFPVELPKRILRCACPPGGIVLDPFFGSGTTGVAAEELGLQWVGIELSKEYIKIAERRLDKYRNNNIDGFV